MPPQAAKQLKARLRDIKKGLYDQGELPGLVDEILLYAADSYINGYWTAREEILKNIEAIAQT